MYCIDFIRIDNIIVLYTFVCFIPSCRGTNQLITRDDTDFFSFEFSFLTRSAHREHRSSPCFARKLYRARHRTGGNTRAKQGVLL